MEGCDGLWDNVCNLLHLVVLLLGTFAMAVTQWRVQRRRLRCGSVRRSSLSGNPQNNSGSMNELIDISFCCVVLLNNACRIDLLKLVSVIIEWAGS